MRTLVLAVCLTCVVHGACAADQALPLARRPDEDAIRKAIRETLDEKPDNQRLHEADTLRANRYDIFERQLDEGTVPDCLHSDGLKRQPTGIGPFRLGGLLALPFVAVAKVRGKCQ